MFTLRSKAIALTTLLGLVALVSLFNWWMGLLAFVAATPFDFRIVTV